jgi:hypothetical protein
VYDTQTLFPAKIIKGITPSKWSGVAIAGSKVVWEPAVPKKNGTVVPLLDGVYENFIGEAIFASFNSSLNGSGEGNGTVIPLLNGTGFGRIDAGLKLGSSSKINISGLAKAPIGWVPRLPNGNASGVLPGDSEISPGDMGQGIEYGSTDTTGMQDGINGTIDKEIGYAKNVTGNGIGQAETPGGEIGINPQPEPPGSEAGGNQPLQPAQAPPAPQKGLLDGIVDFFRGIFGWQ